jgi:hypothetical protein
MNAIFCSVMTEGGEILMVCPWLSCTTNPSFNSAIKGLIVAGDRGVDAVRGFDLEV